MYRHAPSNSLSPSRTKRSQCLERRRRQTLAPPPSRARGFHGGGRDARTLAAAPSHTQARVVAVDAAALGVLHREGWSRSLGRPSQRRSRSTRRGRPGRRPSV
ncbi:hypothetical protein BRADI_1g22551v3 [Brachypodium distachyon]|uniref:Uncharacterized protein n=1 Tax=Brachypodium distachyon TaxID=15368 RepID=A0A2K2DKL6_BRADI|nr:hypothetical protein BRADI_1g22551v3 [Brachypodium distachyon]